jgi:integrase
VTGRPPLEPGTAGKISSVRKGSSWRAFCLFRDFDGTTRSIERTRPTKDKAEKAMAVAIRDRKGASGTGDLTADSTIKQLMEKFWSWKLATTKLAAGSQANYKDIIFRIIIPGLGNLRLREVSTGSLEDWYVKQRTERKAQADLAKTLLNQAFRYALKFNALTYNPAAGISAITDDVKPVRILTDEEIATMREGLRNSRQSAWLLDVFDVQYGLGLRIGEVLALTAGDLDLDNPDGPQVHIRGTIITPTGRPERQPHTKDGPNGHRTLFAPTFVEAILRRLAANLDDETALYRTRSGTFIDPHNARESWRKIRARIGLEWVAPHVLRKTAATRINALFGIEAVRLVMGHKDDKIATTYYVPAEEEQIPDVRAAFE